MGTIVQRRLVRKLDLKRLISKIEPHPAPKAHLEQYTIPADLAAEILYIAAYVYNSIIEKTVVDLGCGTGRLAIGAAFLGARDVIGIDIDKTAVSIARKNAEKLGLKEKTHWIIGEINVACGSFDDVLQNPPFGVQKKGADRSFLTKSIELGHYIYSLHKAGAPSKRARALTIGLKRHKTGPEKTPSLFIKNLVEKNGGKIIAIHPMRMEIPRMFDFHKKLKHEFRVDLFVIQGKAKSTS